MRRTEALAAQAERVIEKWGDSVDSHARRRAYDAWDRILFNQFHDILAGSSIKPAYDDALSELGFAATSLRQTIVEATRRRAVRLPGCPRQRVTLSNLSDRDFAGFVECEPWLGWRGELPLRLTDARGGAIPFQRIVPEAVVNGLARLLFRAEVPAMTETVIEVHHDREEAASGDKTTAPGALDNGLVKCALGARGITALALKETGRELIAPGGIRVECIPDASDTWSHGIDRYGRQPGGVFEAAGDWTVFEEGRLRVTFANFLTFEGSSLVWKVIEHAGDPVIRMRLRLNWSGALHAVKLVIPTTLSGALRVDGCPGGQIERALDEREYPIHDFTSLDARSAGGAAPAAFAVASADVYAGDVSADGTIRLTLLRSPAYAHHDPAKLPTPNYFPIADQGVHEYEIALMPMKAMSMDAVLDEVNRQTRPIWITETTKGMPGR
jgi:alpha-mannosidase